MSCTRQKERKEADSLSNNVLHELKLLNSKIDGLQITFEEQLNSKVNSLRDSLQHMVNENKECLKAEFSQKTKELQDNMDLERSILIQRIEKLEAKLDRTREKTCTRFDPDVSVIISGLLYTEEEDVPGLVNELLAEGLQWEPPRGGGVVAAERTRNRGGRPGVIKVEFGSVQEKISVLRKKQVLRGNAKYKQVYIRSAKTHTERLIELNFKTLLDQMPSGGQFYITGNGRVRKRQSVGEPRGGAVGEGDNSEETRRTDI
ncbi:hypothetical protein WMY93_015732 [Mugilogobius chulae]|uniref:L1 transposable element RRM domain-containing protein n=1 Tax=Mugilogobius chulae TaxID=88201 RepID=A0AAW0NY22_9GOBI